LKEFFYKYTLATFDANMIELTHCENITMQQNFNFDLLLLKVND